MWDAINEWEVQSVIWVQRNLFTGEFWSGFWIFITRMAEHWAIVPIMLLLFFTLGLKQSLRFGFVVATAGFFSWLIKISTNRDRPHLVSDCVEVLYRPISSAFTSGHTAMGCAIAICLTVLVWRMGIHKSLKIFLCSVAIVVFALGVGFSRVYLGVHYPSDIAASFITAVPFYFLSVWLFEKICKIRFRRNKETIVEQKSNPS